MNLSFRNEKMAKISQFSQRQAQPSEEGQESQAYCSVSDQVESNFADSDPISALQYLNSDDLHLCVDGALLLRTNISSLSARLKIIIVTLH